MKSDSGKELDKNSVISNLETTAISIEKRKKQEAYLEEQEELKELEALENKIKSHGGCDEK